MQYEVINTYTCESVINVEADTAEEAIDMVIDNQLQMTDTINNVDRKVNLINN